MTNKSNVIEGREIDRHPFDLNPEPGGSEILRVERRDRSRAPGLAAQAQRPGYIEEPKAKRSFQAGDWIVSDDPPTYAVRIRSDVFDQVYKLRGEPEPEPKTPVVPKQAPRRAATRRTGRAKVRKPRRAPIRSEPVGPAPVTDIATSETLGMIPDADPARPDA